MPDESRTKPRVVIDTNVLVSGLTFKGQPREVLDLAWKGEIEVTISPFICAPGRAHSLGGESPLRTLMAGTVSRTARAIIVRWGLEEAVGKPPA